MSLVSAQMLREIFAIDDQIVDSRFDRAIGAAGTRLRSWVGDAAYDDAGTLPADDEARADDLALAEAHLAMGYAILGINTSMRPTGIVSSERVEGNVTISYLKPADLAALQQQYFEIADQIARPYLDPSKGDGTPGPPVIATGGGEDCDGVLMACGCPPSKCSHI